MAVLSKHGGELYRFDTLIHRISIRSDGQVMRDTGSGWKMWRRMKAGVNPVEYADRQREKHRRMDSEFPSYAAFRDLLCRAFDCAELELQRANQASNAD